MSYNPKLWNRYEFEQLPIYIRSDRPTWFVPNSCGEKLLQSDESNHPQREKFLQRLPAAPTLNYSGRAQSLQTNQLKELWFHITNRCNLSCQHCLFTSGPEATEELSVKQILDRAKEAVDLGCKFFALTGGEPFFHPQIGEILTGLLKFPDCHIVNI